MDGGNLLSTQQATGAPRVFTTDEWPSYRPQLDPVARVRQARDLESRDLESRDLESRVLDRLGFRESYAGISRPGVEIVGSRWRALETLVRQWFLNVGMSGFFFGGCNVAKVKVDLLDLIFGLVLL